MAWNERGNLVNVREHGEHEHQCLTLSRFELLGEENGDRRWEFNVEVELGRL